MSGTPVVCNKDAACVMSESRVRQKCRDFSTAAINNLPFSKKTSLHVLLYWHSILHTINNIQYYQLNAFLLEFVCENNPRVVLSVGNFSILHANIYIL